MQKKQGILYFQKGRETGVRTKLGKKKINTTTFFQWNQFVKVKERHHKDVSLVLLDRFQNMSIELSALCSVNCFCYLNLTKGNTGKISHFYILFQF